MEAKTLAARAFQNQNPDITVCHAHFHVLDIDECSNETNGCDEKAECNNTLGSYNCTCKNGFHGNRTHCRVTVCNIFFLILFYGRIFLVGNVGNFKNFFANSY